MTRDLIGRHALVCGASMGIGRATAVELAARGGASPHSPATQSGLMRSCRSYERAARNLRSTGRRL